MRLDELVVWYQKKIGTYDKQQWEKTIEQKILAGITHLPLKNTKLKTELIDVDLVRGSTFPKAKSKLSILTVIYLAAVRLLFLPVYARWWVKQTSPRVFFLLLSLYLLQMINLGIYSYNVNKTGADQDEHIVSITDFLIPLALSLLLSVIHSQIVATASNSNNLCHGLKKCHSHSTLKKRERIRKRRRARVPYDTGTITKSSLDDPEAQPPKNTFSGTSKSSTGSPMRTAKKQGACSTSSSTSSETLSQNHRDPAPRDENVRNDLVNTSPNDAVFSSEEIMKDLLPNKKTGKSDKKISQLNQTTDGDDSVFLLMPGITDEATSSHQETICTPNSLSTLNGQQVDSTLRRRNVKWDPQVCNSQRTSSRTSSDASNTQEAPVDDDGFESLNGKSSGGEDSSNAGVTAEVYYKKLPYTNTWVSGVPQVDKENRSDSDTDTLRNTPTSQEQLGSAGEIKSNKCPVHLASELGDECSYSSDLNQSDGQNEHSDDDYDLEDAPTIILNPSCGANDRVSCTIWNAREAKKAEMSVLDISSAIIERVEAMPETCDYVYIGVVLSLILSLVPAFCRLCEATVDSTNATELNFLDLPVLLLEKTSFSCMAILRFAFGDSNWEKTVLILGFVLRLCLTYLIFFLLAVAERTFKQRFLYAKLFSHLTSSRRAQKSGIPHFRLNKVRNIKTWLCVRSYLKRRGPQNSVDVIVSAAFIITLLLLAFLSVEWLKDSVHMHSQVNLEALVWSCAFGTFLLRFMTLGTKINKKYKSVSVLITEQINLYVQIEQKPNKKDELMISNNVLKLAADLLKELESPFKISGLSANPYLYTTVKVVILSALSGVLSEMLGFKLKLHKIKIK
ncbi:protein phtf isoform X3 [Malaya genurostris]|uniref:protein phtf isoform X3 n=1 Tax=Malaya genurostris TaxID=325434 RepID=UPI0026F3DAF8|nr:protein phtf isoform X3 [Malaya genurostris]